MSEANIRVCCRFRPKSEIEIEKDTENSSDCIRIKDNTVYVEGERQLEFTYDHIFDTEGTQEDVFKYTASRMIKDVLDGYNCTIFAYGQTASGKTFTVTGYEEPGLIPRMFASLFDKIQHHRHSVEFSVNVSYVEIYLEKIKDLLNPVEDNLRIREGGYKPGIWIQGVVEEYVNSYDDLMELVDIGTSNRSIAETQMNQRSSRSHSVFICTVNQVALSTGVRKSSKIIFVDLAGSEKVSKTGATGWTLLQAQYTNRSLTYLGIVIRALVEKAPHIPYRDSKLTRILTDSLGGNSKTCLIITCSSSAYNLEETISTLRFGANVKVIKNRPKMNVEMSIAEYRKLLEQAEKRIQELEGDNKTPSAPPEKVEQLENQIRELELDLAERKNAHDDIIDDLKQQLAEKDEQIIQTEKKALEVLKEKDKEIEIVRDETEMLKREILSKTNDVLSAERSGSTVKLKEYYENILKTKNNMISLLNTALKQAELAAETQKRDYEQMIVKLKKGLSNPCNTIPRITRTVSRNLIIPKYIQVVSPRSRSPPTDSELS